MIIKIKKINDNKNVFSSIVCEVNKTVFFYKYYKRLKHLKAQKQVLSTYDTLKKRYIKIIDLFYISSNFCCSFYA